MNAAEELVTVSPSHEGSTRAETVLILACSFVCVPLVLNRDLYWDDWSLFWIYWSRVPPDCFSYTRKYVGSDTGRRWRSSSGSAMGTSECSRKPWQ